VQDKKSKGTGSALVKEPFVYMLMSWVPSASVWSRWRCRSSVRTMIKPSW